MGPKIHRKLWDHYEGNLPSDPTIRSFLIRKLEFNDSTVGKFIKEFRSTIAFANLTKADTLKGEKGDGHQEPHKKAQPTLADSFPSFDGATPGQATAMRDLPITLPSLNIAILRLPARMSELDFTTLVSSLNAWKPALVSKNADHASGIDDNDGPESIPDDDNE